MRYVIRTLTYVLMTIVIAVTSVQLAAARGQAPAVGLMEICTGTGPIHFLVDENGDPTGGVMICPDYALAFYADATAPLPQATRLEIWHVLWLGQTGAVSADQVVPHPQARGPPVSV
ncbi:hypothetical protein [Marivita sp.]|uniref:hypothetical protein n=1 Tax=Marivita sp. TaxID=2003365 RepID=UPI003F4A959A